MIWKSEPEKIGEKNMFCCMTIYGDSETDTVQGMTLALQSAGLEEGGELLATKVLKADDYCSPDCLTDAAVQAIDDWGPNIPSILLHGLRQPPIPCSCGEFAVEVADFTPEELNAA